MKKYEESRQSENLRKKMKIVSTVCAKCAGSPKIVQQDAERARNEALCGLHGEDGVGLVCWKCGGAIWTNGEEARKMRGTVLVFEEERT